MEPHFFVSSYWKEWGRQSKRNYIVKHKDGGCAVDVRLNADSSTGQGPGVYVTRIGLHTACLQEAVGR